MFHLKLDTAEVVYASLPLEGKPLYIFRECKVLVETRYYYSVYDVEDITDLTPASEPMTHSLGIQTLTGDGYRLLVLTNNSFTKKELTAKLRVNIPFSSAEFFAVDGEKTVTVKGNELEINITDGGVLVLR